MSPLRTQPPDDPATLGQGDGILKDNAGRSHGDVEATRNGYAVQVLE